MSIAKPYGRQDSFDLHASSSRSILASLQLWRRSKGEGLISGIS